MNLERNDRFLWTEYLKNLFPVMFSVLGGTINALIDGILVSQKLGPEGLAAVNMSMPFYMIICTFGAMISSGACIMSGAAAGEEKMDEAAAHYRSALTLSIITGALLTVLGLLTVSPLAAVLTHGSGLRDYVYGYSLVTVIGSVPMIISYIPLLYLQLDGKMKDISVMMVIMIVTDILLDILLMFVFPLGVYGASAASVVSMLIACVYGFIRLRSGYSNYRLGAGKITLSETFRIFRVGTPSALGNLTDAVKLLILNTVIIVTGGEEAAAVWAVLNSLSEFSITITSGVPQSAAPMTSVYYAARENSGIRILMKHQIQSGIVLSVFFGAMLVILREFIQLIFAVNINMTLPLICLGIYVVFEMVCSVITTFFSVTERTGLSNVFVLLRKIVFPVMFALVFSQSLVPVWWFLPAGAFCSMAVFFAATVIISAGTKKNERPLSAVLLLDDYLEREKKVIDFSIVPSEENICTASEQIKVFCDENSMDMKQAMKLQLAIEELLSVIVQNNKGLESVDLRAFAVDENTGIRIRCAGIRYDPFDSGADEDEMMMGVIMLRKMAKSVSYTYALGMNTINIMFENNSTAVG